MTPDASTDEFDLVVVGGGPGGSTTAGLVAQEGHRVLLLEKEEFPRYQIGESLLPATTKWICGLLGVSDRLAEASFPVKTGGTFLWGSNPEPWSFSFSTKGHGERHAYQVERSKFDQILLDNARRLGVEVHERSRVTGVESDDERVRGVRYVDADGHERRVRSRFVVDASGNQSNLYRGICGHREYSEDFRHIAMFGYFEGGKRQPEPRAGNILCAAFRGGWFWYIPLSDELTSVGAVVPAEMGDVLRGDREEVFADLISQSPIISEHLADARRVTTGQYGQIRVRKDYSYCTEKFWSPGFALVGDAACFVDPLFSTGVYLATYSGLLTARSVNSTLSGRVPETVAFAESEYRHRREYELYHEFLRMMYGSHVDEDSYFWDAKRLVNSAESHADAFSEITAGFAPGEFSHVEVHRPEPAAPQEAGGTAQGSGGVAIAPPRTSEADEDAAMRRFWRGRAKQRLDGADQHRLLQRIEAGWRDRAQHLTASPDGVHWELTA